MIQRGEHFGFTLQTSESLDVSGQRVGQDLDRDDTLQVGVYGAIDLAHAAGANPAADFIYAESSARG
jgi:hypothetical protein